LKTARCVPDWKIDKTNMNFLWVLKSVRHYFLHRHLSYAPLSRYLSHSNQLIVTQQHEINYPLPRAHIRNIFSDNMTHKDVSLFRINEVWWKKPSLTQKMFSCWMMNIPKFIHNTLFSLLIKQRKVYPKKILSIRVWGNLMGEMWFFFIFNELEFWKLNGYFEFKFYILKFLKKFRFKILTKISICNLLYYFHDLILNVSF
jgi:hypothetical protein